MIIDNRYYRIKSIFGYRLRALLPTSRLAVCLAHQREACQVSFTERSIKYRKNGWLTLGSNRGCWALLLLLWTSYSSWKLRPPFTLRSSLLWPRDKHCQKDRQETWNVDHIDTHTQVEHQTILEHTKHISTIASSALHTFCSNLLVLVFLCCVHDCTLNKCDALKSVFKRYFSVAFFIFYILPPSVMFDSSAPLSLADEPSGLEDSFISAASSTRVDRLEKDVATLSKRLDQEERARKRLQELLSSSGISLPQDLADSQAWTLNNLLTY